MIIITTPRKIGELGRHLGKTGRGANKQVIIRDDLIRDAPVDTTLALRMMAALARRNQRVTRDIVHVKIAPKISLSPNALERVLTVFEEEYGIPFDCPRHVVEHRKGDRAPHFHVNYPMTVPGSGKALRFTRSADRDEMIARRLELELGEGLTPSLRVERVAEMLRERGLSELAAIVATGPVAQKGLGRSKAERQQAKRLEADFDLLDARLLEAWRRSGEDLRMLPVELEQLGFRLAAGDKLVAGVPMVRLIDTETLLATSLTRNLNRVRKAFGDTIRLQEPELGAVIGKLLPEGTVKAELRRDAPQRSAADLLGEFDRLIAETEADGEREEVVKAKKGRARVAARLTTDEQKHLRERQNLVRSRYRQRDRIRRARVNRSCIAAGVFADRDIRRLAFYLVAAGALATGAGVIMALAVAGVAVASLPSYQSAKHLRTAANRAAVQDRAAMAAELQLEARRFFRERAIAKKVADQRERQQALRERANLAARMQAGRAQARMRNREMERAGHQIRAKAAEVQLARAARNRKLGRAGQGDGGQQRVRPVSAPRRGRDMGR